MDRLNNSMARLAMPNFDNDEMIALIKKFCEVERDWVPKGQGYSLYLRPTAIGTHPFFGKFRAKRCEPQPLCCLKDICFLLQNNLFSFWRGAAGEARRAPRYFYYTTASRLVTHERAARSAAHTAGGSAPPSTLRAPA